MLRRKQPKHKRHIIPGLPYFRSQWRCLPQIPLFLFFSDCRSSHSRYRTLKKGNHLAIRITRPHMAYFRLPKIINFSPKENFPDQRQTVKSHMGKRKRACQLNRVWTQLWTIHMSRTCSGNHLRKLPRTLFRRLAKTCPFRAGAME